MFIGQQRILKELSYLIPAMQEGKNLNLLFRAPSGFGKTKLAVGIAYQIDSENIDYNIIEDGVLIDESKRIIIIDEVHLLKNPETIYPILDNQQHIFILCSNESGELKEPLLNRCIVFTFESYTPEEIGVIIYEDFVRNNQNLPAEVIVEIVQASNLNPRIARKLVERLSIIFRTTGVPQDREEIIRILRDILQIEDGLNPFHRKYLEYLEKVQRASLDSIIYATRIDRGTILKEVEPVLVQRNLIMITSRGRVLCQ